MNTSLMTFEKAELGQVRTVMVDGEPWFIAVDVCRILDLTDVSKSVSRLDEDEKGTNSIRTLGGEQEVLTINEPGLYSLILTSRKEEAKRFKRWVTHEVLPTIRRQGFYSMLTPEKLMEVLTEKYREDKTYLDSIDKAAIKKAVLNETREARLLETRKLWTNIYEYEWTDFAKEIKKIWRGDMPMLHKYLDRCEKDFKRIAKGEMIITP